MDEAEELVVPGLGGTGGATLLSRGSIIVRMINIGREPRTTTTQTGFDAAAQVQVGKRTRIRARPAWEPDFGRGGHAQLDEAVSALP
ncbi:hypothetical protein HaLaN_21620 [Haematococcus lacustris]|uniref:Uncharacterized protein n=1 Tax=Haematococcus lacustris TaxID=44745 RepID=A0A699ZPQ9_HAELA|nr:hypothetical protein HaLaN_21620 [Haematococcus lacustris]